MAKEKAAPKQTAEIVLWLEFKDDKHPAKITIHIEDGLTRLSAIEEQAAFESLDAVEDATVTAGCIGMRPKDRHDPRFEEEVVSMAEERFLVGDIQRRTYL